MQEITLTQNTFTLFPTVYAVQNDTGRELKMIIQDQTLLLGDTGAVAVQRSDGSYYTIAATIQLGDNAFKADISQALTQPGRTLCQLKVTRSDLVISTYTFAIMVQPSTDGVPAEQLGVTVDELMEAAAQLTLSDNDVKLALLQIAEKVVYIDPNGQDYYDALLAALYPPIRATGVTLDKNSLVFSDVGGTDTLTATVSPNNVEDPTVYWGSSDKSVAVVSDGIVTAVAAGSCTITATCGTKHASASVLVAQVTLVSISASYTQTGTIYNDGSLDDILTEGTLVVTATWSDNSQTTVPNEDVTLSGTLTVGTSTITASYGGETDTFSVTVTQSHTLYQLRNQTMTTDTLITIPASQLNVMVPDQDFTIALDTTIDTKSGDWKIFYYYENASPWRGLVIAKGGSTFNAKYYNSTYTLASSAANVSRVRAVITHTAGSGKAIVYYRLNSAATTSSGTMSQTYTALTMGSFYIGKHSTNTWSGTIAKFDILDYAMSQAEAETYIVGN